MSLKRPLYGIILITFATLVIYIPAIQGGFIWDDDAFVTENPLIHASDETINQLFENNQVVLQYADENGKEADRAWPLNPNGSLRDIAGICDPTGRVFGLMPHPEAFNHFTNHPDWTRKKQAFERQDGGTIQEEGEGLISSEMR